MSDWDLPGPAAGKRDLRSAAEVGSWPAPTFGVSFRARAAAHRVRFRCPVSDSAAFGSATVVARSRLVADPGRFSRMMAAHEDATLAALRERFASRLGYVHPEHRDGFIGGLRKAGLPT